MSNDLIAQTIELDIWAGWHQFHLQDDEITLGKDANLWNDKTIRQMLAVGDRFIWIGTARHATVPVKLFLTRQSVTIDQTKYDLVNRCGLDIQTGRIVLGMIEYWPDAYRINAPPGYYEVLVCYAKLNALRGNGLEGDDFYDLFVSPCEGPIDLQTLKDVRPATI